MFKFPVVIKVIISLFEAGSRFVLHVGIGPCVFYDLQVTFSFPPSLSIPSSPPLLSAVYLLKIKPFLSPFGAVPRPSGLPSLPLGILQPTPPVLTGTHGITPRLCLRELPSGNLGTCTWGNALGCTARERVTGSRFPKERKHQVLHLLVSSPPRGAQGSAHRGHAVCGGDHSASSPWVGVN